jgi:hypothetical protein
MRQVFGSFGSTDPPSLCTTGGQRKENILDSKGSGHAERFTSGPSIRLPECKTLKMDRFSRKFGPSRASDPGRDRTVRACSLAPFALIPAIEGDEPGPKAPVERVTFPTGHLGIRAYSAQGLAWHLKNPNRLDFVRQSAQTGNFASDQPAIGSCIIWSWKACRETASTAPFSSPPIHLESCRSCLAETICNA